jgi:ATP-dependent Clp protease ATP-binding subunit ClpC
VYPFERFSDHAKRVLTLAQAEAERSQHSYIGTEHLALGMLAEQESVGGLALLALGVDEGRLRRDLEAASQEPRAILKQLVPTSRVKAVIEQSFELAREEGRSYVGTDHMLLALLADRDGVATRALAAQGVIPERARQAIERVRGSGVEERPSQHRPAGPPAAMPGTDVPHQYRKLAQEDAKGRAVQVDVFLPEGYTEAEGQALLARIRDAIRGGEPA